MLNKRQVEFIKQMVELNYYRTVDIMVTGMKKFAEDEIERGLLEYGKGYEPMSSYDIGCEFFYDESFDALIVYDMLPESITKKLKGKTKEEKSWELSKYVTDSWDRHRDDFEGLYDSIYEWSLKEAAAKLSDYSDKEIMKRIVPDVETWTCLDSLPDGIDQKDLMEKLEKARESAPIDAWERTDKKVSKELKKFQKKISKISNNHKA